MRKEQINNEHTYTVPLERAKAKEQPPTDPKVDVVVRPGILRGPDGNLRTAIPENDKAV
jgi:hypothetical protein